MVSTTAGTTTAHPHKCRKCGKQFTGTCAHLYSTEGRYGQIHMRDARPHEFPFEVRNCADCAFEGF